MPKATPATPAVESPPDESEKAIEAASHEQTKSEIKKPAAKEPAPTEAELNRHRRNMIAAQYGEGHVPPELREPEKPAEGDEPPPEEEPKGKDEKDGEDETAVDETPKPAKKKSAAATKAKPAPTHDELITKAAAETGKAVAREMTRHKEVVEEEPEGTTPVDELNDEDKRDSMILSEMENIFPDARGITGKFADYCKKRYDYQAKWEAAHPDDQFNFDDTEHQAWVDKNQPKIDPEQFEDAKASIRYQRMKERDPEVQEFRTGKALIEAAPKIVANIDNRIAQLVESYDEELGKIVRNDKGKPDLTDAALKKLEAADPVAKDILEQLVNSEFHPMVEELEKTAALPGYRLQPERNPVHASLINHLQRAELDIQSLPAEEQIWEGRKFATNSQLAAMRDKVQSSKLPTSEKSKRLKALEESYWTVGVDELEDLLVDHFVKKAQKEVSRIQLLSEKSGKKKNGAPAETVQEPKDEPPPKPIVKTPKPRPPSTASGSDTQTNRDAAVIDATKFQENAEKSFFS